MQYENKELNYIWPMETQEDIDRRVQEIRAETQAHPYDVWDNKQRKMQ